MSFPTHPHPYHEYYFGKENELYFSCTTEVIIKTKTTHTHTYTMNHKIIDNGSPLNQF